MTDFDYWDWKDIKDKGFLVGLTMEYFTEGISISQALFFINVFKFFGIWDNLPPIMTLLPPKYHVVPVANWSPEDEAFMKDKPYHCILGCCWWGASSST